jgi:outer membrane protein assembly factor BamB
MRYLLGACAIGSQGVIVVAGGGEVRCIGARSGKILWTTPLRGRTVSGRGCIAQGTVLVPVDRNEVFLIEVETGKRVGNFEVGTTGNIVLAGEHALVTGNGTLSVHRVGAALPAPPPQKGQDF